MTKKNTTTKTTATKTATAKKPVAKRPPSIITTTRDATLPGIGGQVGLTIKVKIFKVADEAVKTLQDAGVQLTDVEALGPEAGDRKTLVAWLKTKRALRTHKGGFNAKIASKRLSSMTTKLEKFAAKRSDAMPADVKELVEMAIASMQEAERKMVAAK